MHLHSYRLKNYRRLRDVHIELAPDISIFVGANNSGKTSATQAIQMLLSGAKDRFSLFDFSSHTWNKFDELGNMPEGKLAEAPIISLDLWFEVTAVDLYLVIPLLPSTAWKGTQVGLRIEFGAKNTVELVQKFRDARLEAQKRAAAMKGGTGNYVPWPKSLSDFLQKELQHEFEFRYYALDRAQFDAHFIQNNEYQPLILGRDEGGANILKTLIRVDFLNAQRHLADPPASAADGAGRSEDLSKRLSRFYQRNLDQRQDDYTALKALFESETELNNHLAKVFEPTLKRLEKLGYPGLNNPRLEIKSALNPASIMRQDARVHYVLGAGVDTVTLPDTYRCNGLSSDGCQSDRVSQTVNGVNTNYVLDQAAGLTQVLDDGTNTYLYGLGRIAQVNSTGTEYFLGDALGSVRQMTDASGAVTMAKAYDPFGVVSMTSGTSQSAYGYTGEQQSQGLVYLRSRVYAPSVGRFLTRDTWAGDPNQPMSYNLWNYGLDNPSRYTDPTGNAPIEPCLTPDTELVMVLSAVFPLPDFRGLCIVRKVMKPDPYDYVNTYTAAGVAIESQWYLPWVDTRGGLYWKINPDYYHNGLGICNVSLAQMYTVFGAPISEPGKENHQYGLGLGIYQNQEDPAVAVEAMRMRIRQVTNNPDPRYQCKDCSVSDFFVLAALAESQNFYLEDIKHLKNFPVKKPTPRGLAINWIDYFHYNSSEAFSYRHIKLFYMDIIELRKRSPGWVVPDINWKEIEDLSNGIQSQ